ncbi:TPA: hypothetical protein NR419_002610 [Listeria innocua]|nr:hypothetical protein [Listeria innocua]
MIKMVILLFLFIGGVGLLWNEVQVSAAEMNSETSILFEDTYVYQPEPKLDNTPTVGNSKSSYETLPKLSDSRSIYPQILGIVCLIFGFVLKKIERRKRR